MRWLPLLLLVACADDPARFRPAKGVHDQPSSKDAFRVQEVPENCLHLGGVVEAESVEDVATTAANHGGTHYVLLGDQATAGIETTTTGTTSNGATVVRSSSRAVKHHRMIARVFRCPD